MNKYNIKQYLIFGIIILIVLIILSTILKNWGSIKSDENYKSESYVDDFISQSYRVKDRETYYTLEKIIIDFIASYNPLSNYDNEITYKDYYASLSNNYNKHLSYNEYLNVAEQFLQDFYITQNVSSNSELVFREILKEIYKKDDNKYMCVLRNNNMIIDKYIGIVLNDNNDTFNIFYIK